VLQNTDTTCVDEETSDGTRKVFVSQFTGLVRDWQFQIDVVLLDFLPS
jgi:hypothetical protein